VNEVTAKDVLALAKELFKVKEMHLAVIGPVKKEDVLKMLKNK